MPTKTWKNRERQIARFFGSERNPLSGGNGKHTRSDSLHEELFIESKHRKSHSLVTLYEEVKKQARAENKIPVICLSQHGKKGFWVMVKEEDLTAVANQRLIAKRGE